MHSTPAVPTLTVCMIRVGFVDATHEGFVSSHHVGLCVLLRTTYVTTTCHDDDDEKQQQQNTQQSDSLARGWRLLKYRTMGVACRWQVAISWPCRTPRRKSIRWTTFTILPLPSPPPPPTKIIQIPQPTWVFAVRLCTVWPICRKSLLWRPGATVKNRHKSWNLVMTERCCRTKTPSPAKSALP
jgi:hypothetical protein